MDRERANKLFNLLVALFVVGLILTGVMEVIFKKSQTPSEGLEGFKIADIAGKGKAVTGRVVGNGYVYEMRTRGDLVHSGDLPLFFARPISLKGIKGEGVKTPCFFKEGEEGEVKYLPLREFVKGIGIDKNPSYEELGAMDWKAWKEKKEETSNGAKGVGGPGRCDFCEGEALLTSSPDRLCMDCMKLKSEGRMKELFRKGD